MIALEHVAVIIKIPMNLYRTLLQHWSICSVGYLVFEVRAIKTQSGLMSDTATPECTIHRSH